MALANAMGWNNPFTEFVGNNRQTLMGLGAGIAGGRNFGQGLASGLAMAAQGKQADEAAVAQKQAEEERKAQISATAQFLRSKGAEDLAVAVESGMTSGGDAFNTWYQQANAPAGGASAPSNVQEWQYYSQLSPEQQSQYLTMKRSNSPLNIGTGFVTQDMANPGQIIGAPIAINNQQAEYDKGYGGVRGKAAGEVDVLADSVSSKMPGLRSVVDTLSSLADTATYTQSGQAMDAVKRELGLPVGQGAIDRASYIAIVDNQVLPLLKDTFGAAFTVQEGESLRATLGDPNKSPAEKKAILNAFIEQKERDVRAMQGGGGSEIDDILSGYGL
jgi:hypothetical protein